MIAPREVFIIENVGGQIFVHSTKGPMVFLELGHAEAMINGDPEGNAAERKTALFGKKWAVTRIPMNPELSSQPFRYYEQKKCDTQKMPENAIYLADLRDKVATAANSEKLVINVPVVETELTGDMDKLGGLSPDPNEERMELRNKLRKLQVNPRNVRKLPKLREMLTKAEAEAVPA